MTTSQVSDSYYILLTEKLDDYGNFDLNSVTVYDSRDDMFKAITNTDDEYRMKSFTRLKTLSHKTAKNKSFVRVTKSICKICNNQRTVADVMMRKCMCLHEKIYDIDLVFSDISEKSSWFGPQSSGMWQYCFQICLHPCN